MKRNLYILVMAIICLFHNEASAFWWSDSTENASGLNVASGFDVNTITKVSGTVLTPPERKGEDHTIMTVSAPQGVVNVVLGPYWYWEKQSVAISAKNEVSITGSLAQGKDGALYLFAQKVENRTTGKTEILRTDSGKPLWSNGGTGSQSGRSQSGNIRSGAGAGSRMNGFRGGRR